jgi:RNA polymerase sigma factor (sigma-70 family)
MPESDDIALLMEYAGSGSESAFAELIARYVNLVYSAALRGVGDAHAAQEIAQAVFIILARKAKSLGDKTVLSGWLYQTARLTAANYLRGEIRRQNREQEAYMQAILNEPEAEAWRQIAPLLDDAMGRLGEKDRNAIVLRFFENKNLSEVGAALGASEDAAKMRVNRALEKLRKFFTKRGVTHSAAIIAGAVSVNSVQAAPAGLAATATATAVKGTTISATITTLVKGTLKIMAYTKLKLAIGITAGILLAGGAVMVAISQTSSDDKWTPQEIAKESQDAYAALSSYSDSGTIVVEGSGENTKTTFNIRLQRPKFYRVDWKSTGGLYTAAGVVWSEGKGDFLVSGPVERVKSDQPQRMNDMQQAFAMAMGVSSSAATIPATFYKQNYGDVLGVPAMGRSQLKKEGDEKVGDVDCYVFSSMIDPAKLPNKGELPNNTGKVGTVTTMFWIGKQDHLIHQTRQTMEGMSIAMPRQSDDSIKTILERQNKPSTPEAVAAWRTQMDTMMKQAQGAKFVFTETHENISVNQKFSPADFSQ